VNRLAEIVARRRSDICAERRCVPIETLYSMLAERTSHRPLASALGRLLPTIIAEIKRASPTAGAIDLVCDAGAVAHAYERGGACAVSVLTEPHCFGGSFADLARVRAATALPVLCKDFVVDDFQLWKAAAFGADALLLIVGALEQPQLTRFLALASSLDLETLVEVYDEREAERALAAGARLVGVNNRNLATLRVDRSTVLRLRGMLPSDCIVVAESGYRDPGHLRQAMAAGVNAFLIGESLMRTSDREQAVRRLRGVPACCA